MLRSILYFAVVLNVLYALLMLLNKKYRTRKLLWAPIISLGAAIQLVAYLLRITSTTRDMVAILGSCMVIATIVWSRKRRQLG